MKNRPSPFKSTSFKIMTAGFVFAVTGALIVASGLTLIGRVIVYAGFVVGFIGLAMHLRLVLSSLKGAFKDR